jgi:hypothetical protein
LGVYEFAAYRDKKVVGVFVRFRAPFTNTASMQSVERVRGQESLAALVFCLFSLRGPGILSDSQLSYPHRYKINIENAIPYWSLKKMPKTRWNAGPHRRSKLDDYAV